MSSTLKQSQSLQPFVLLLVGLVVGVFATVAVLRNSMLPANDDVSGDKPQEQPLLTMYGTVRTGAQLNRTYCAEGLYLVSEMTNGVQPPTTDVRLLKVKTPEGQAMFQESRFVDTKVVVGSAEPLMENTCKALSCECEPSLFVEGMSEDIPPVQ